MKKNQLSVKVGNVNVNANTVKQCKALVGVAKKLSETAPIKVKSDTFSIQTGTPEQCTQMTSTARTLAKASPVQLKALGTSAKAGTIKQLSIVVAVGVAAFGLTAGIKSLIDSKFKKKDEEDNPTSPEPEPTKMESLNETISKNGYGSKGMRMVGDLIRYGGINLFFSPTGEGKSVLVMQLAIDISSGQGSLILPEKERKAMRPMLTIVYDEEQDEDDIKERYGQNNVHYPENLKRIESCMFDDEKQLLNDIDKHVKEVSYDVCIIIDNITSIIPTMSNNKVRKFYNRLKQIQKQKKDSGFRVTYIIVAHTIKGYSYPISLRDLAGGANISNFLNRAIALLPTKYGEETKILKVLKARDTLKGNGKVIKMVKEPYIHFEYEKTVELKDALSDEMLAEVNKFISGEGINQQMSAQNASTPPKEERQHKIRKLFKKGIKQKDIASRLGITDMMVSRDLAEMREKGQLD